MKLTKLILSLAILVTVLEIRAEMVSESVAQRIAQNFVRQVNGFSTANLRLVSSLNRTAYIFGNDSGFVIVAADDRVIPILGYSTEGRL